MRRIEMYCDVLAETLPLSKDMLMAKLQSFIDRNGQWRDYFLSEVRAYEEGALAQNIRERRDILLAWLMIGGSVAPASPLQKRAAF